ncbi:MAG: phage tail assembly chaperone [Paracoccaceae bacterium]
MNASGLDWPGLMRAGMTRAERGGLGLLPAAFWALTPAELALMLGAEAGQAPLTRARLNALAQAYPDRTTEESDGRHG